MKDIIMHTLFSLIEALTSAPPSTTQQLEQALQVPIVLTNENEYYQFWGIAKSLKLNDGTQVERVDFATSRTGHKPPSLALRTINGTCISREELTSRFGYLGFPLPPNNPAPGAQSIWKIEIQGIEVGFGFRNDNPDCLSYVGMRFDKSGP